MVFMERSEKFMKDDRVYLEKRKSLAQDLGIENLWDIIDQFALYSGIQTLGGKLAVYEIMKKCLDIPGHIVEFGCWKGANLMFMAKVLQLLQPNTLKHIYGFDSFEGLQTFATADKVGNEFKGKYCGNEKTLLKIINLFGMDEWVHIIKGNALETIPQFEQNNPHLMFSLAYIDFDLYEPTKVALEFIARRMCSGGIIVLDEALTNMWPGEGQAVVEFLENNNNQYYMHNITFARQPTMYMVKK